jgi:hypothetical protein
MSAALTLTAGSGRASIASSDPGAVHLFGAVTNGWPVSSRVARRGCAVSSLMTALASWRLWMGGGADEPGSSRRGA